MTKPIVIIGGPGSVFANTLASNWKNQGERVLIVTRHWAGEKTLPNGVKILNSAEFEGFFIKRMLKLIMLLLNLVERWMITLENGRYTRVMGERTYRPSFPTALIFGLSIASYVRSLKPKFVFGLEAYAYGPATALCFRTPRVLMPWGGDIYTYANTSFISLAIMKAVLRNVDLVCPTSESSVKFIIEKYRIPTSKVQAISWGVDLDLCNRADINTRKQICVRLNIDPQSLIITNIRRFKPMWGSKVILHAFCKLAQMNPSLHFILIGGTGSEAVVENALQEIKRRGLENRFLIFRDQIPLDDYLEILSISDISVSLVIGNDMRSLSVLQAAASGSALVLSDREEYRIMMEQGFRCLFVDAYNSETFVNTISMLSKNEQLRKKMVVQNKLYLENHEDRKKQMELLTSRIASI